MHRRHRPLNHAFHDRKRERKSWSGITQYVYIAVALDIASLQWLFKSEGIDTQCFPSIPNDALDFQKQTSDLALHVDHEQEKRHVPQQHIFKDRFEAIYGIEVMLFGRKMVMLMM
jgi:hypothetical protein